MSTGRNRKRKNVQSAGSFFLCLCLLLNLILPGSVFAAMEEQNRYEVTFHDIDANGEEILSAKKAVSVEIGEGKTLNEGISGKKLRIGADKRNVSDLIWYTLDEDGTKERFDPDTEIEEDLDLYTYTYGVRLIEEETYADFWNSLDPEALALINSHEAGLDSKTATASDASAKKRGKKKASVFQSLMAMFRATSSDAEEEETDIRELLDDEQNEMLEGALHASRYIEAREGDPIEALSGETKEPVEWTELETGETVNLETLAENGLTENETLIAVLAGGGTIKCYVVIDGKEELVDTITTSKRSTTMWESSRNRWYVTASELEAVYGKFGFDAETYQGSYCFPYADDSNDWAQGRNQIWANCGPVRLTDDSDWAIPLSWRNPTYLFYMPDVQNGTESYIVTTGSLKGSFPRTDQSEAFLANTFHTIEISDPDLLAYNLDSQIPEIQYVYHGDQISVEVPAIPDGDGTWTLTDPEGNSAGTGATVRSEGDKLIYTFSNVSGSYCLTAVPAGGKKIVNIECYAIVNGNVEQISTIRTAWGPAKKDGWSSARYYITAEDLEHVYGAFGFSADDYDGGRIFPHTTDSAGGSGKLWADVPPVSEKNEDGETEWLIPVSDGTTSYLYYLPNLENYCDQTAYTCANPKKNSASPAFTYDNFYSVKVKDEHHLAYADDLYLPDLSYVHAGEAAELSVKAIVDSTAGHWEIRNADTNVELDAKKIRSQNGMVTYRIEQVDGPVLFETAKENPRAAATINCYAPIDGTMTLVRTLTRAWGPVTETDPGADPVTGAARTWNWGGSGHGRYYITAAELADVYSAFGFRDKIEEFASIASSDWYSYASEHRYFANTDHAQTNSADKMWADALMTKHGSEIRIPLCQGDNLSSRVPLELYYLPENDSDHAGYFSASKNVNDAAACRANSFYALSISDPQGSVYSKKSDIPAAKYGMEGDTVFATVPIVDGVSWNVKWSVNGAETYEPVTSTDNGNGTLTYTVKFQSGGTSYPCSVTIEASSSKPSVIYQAELKQEDKVAIGTSFKPADQETVQDGTIRGFTTYADPMPEDEEYTVLGLDYGYAVVESKDATNRRWFYSLAGWKVQGTNPEVILQPGQVISKAELESYADAGSRNVVLLPQWRTTESTNSMIESINFYVSLDCEVRDNQSDGITQHPANMFSNSVYATRIIGGASLANAGITTPVSTGLVTQKDNSSSAAYETDRILRNSGKTPITAETDHVVEELKKGDWSIRLASFPSDEEILEKLRAGSKTITMDGNAIAKEDLTTNNFTIRWAVLKYEHSDGWHIDGALVAKKAKFTVKKTFAGDNEAIREVKRTYQIKVSHTETSGTGQTTEVVDYQLVLKPGDSAGNQETGYSSFDPDTNTYTWTVDARQNRQYRVDEIGYTLGDSKWNSSCYYMIRNSNSDTGGWRVYDPDTGVSLVAEAYASDLPENAIQAVELRNVYVQAGLLTIHKIDNATKNGLSGVDYRISRIEGDGAEDETFVIYRKPGTYQYSADSSDRANGFTATAKDNTATTDANGSFYIKLPVGTYDLEEEIPVGYDGAKKIRVKVTDEGSVKFDSIVMKSEGEPPVGGWIEEADGTSLTIRNRSKLLVSVTAKKNWVNTPESEKVPVVVELWCDGMKLPESTYKQELNADNGWTYTWNNLPLFLDGSLADYSLRETKIGDVAYDAEADTDGYQEYMVTYDAALYKQGENGTYSTVGAWRDDDGTYQYADHALLTVNNYPNKGAISFVKTDAKNQALAGAEFTLYSDEACTKEVAKSISNAAGFVIFEDRMVGTYYMKETSPPAGYRANDTKYKVVLSGRRSEITEADGDGTELSEIRNVSNMFLILKKVNADGKPIGGAEFEIKQQGGLTGTCKVAAGGTKITGQNADWGLAEGDYLFKETKAPRGYEMRKEVPIIRLKNGEFSFVQDGSTGSSADGAWTLTKDLDADPTGCTWVLTVEDDELYTLPSVGGPGMYAVFVLGTGLMCLAAAALILPAGRRRTSKRK